MLFRKDEMYSLTNYISRRTTRPPYDNSHDIKRIWLFKVPASKHVCRQYISSSLRLFILRIFHGSGVCCLYYVPQFRVPTSAQSFNSSCTRAIATPRHNLIEGTEAGLIQPRPALHRHAAIDSTQRVLPGTPLLPRCLVFAQ
jgi:hypothetical protein